MRGWGWWGGWGGGLKTEEDEKGETIFQGDRRETETVPMSAVSEKGR